MDPFASDSHVTWALYSIGMALVVAVLLLADVVADHHHELKSGARCGKKWWQK
jgi:fatty-acid desaturase